MRLGLYGWAIVVAVVVLGLAGWVIRRPLVDWAEGESSAVPGGSGPMQSLRVRFEPVASGFAGPVDLNFVPGSPDVAVVLEKGGRARLVRLPSARSAADAGAPGADAALESPGPDVLSVVVHEESELGLLGLAFHPRYAQNGLIYLNTNPKDGGPLRTRISEWHWPLEAVGKAQATQKRVLLEIPQPFKNHDGGQLAFGSDGFLYIGMGDGGSRRDPQGHGQNLESLLGKILRIDVDAAPGYGVPGDNPFTKTPGAKPEIWAYGLRNPWRFSFDPKGRLIAADVGQDSYEEVDIVSAGANMGWKVREASHCFFPAEGCPTAGLVEPIFEYGRDAGQSITGGHVYLGKSLPWLYGKYVFGDFVTGRAWALELPEQAAQPGRAEELGVFQLAFSAFGRAPSGELFALDFARGLILRLGPA